jgi:hypothetical protein
LRGLIVGQVVGANSFAGWLTLSSAGAGPGASAGATERLLFLLGDAEAADPTATVLFAGRHASLL